MREHSEKKQQILEKLVAFFANKFSLGNMKINYTDDLKRDSCSYHPEIIRNKHGILTGFRLILNSATLSPDKIQEMISLLIECQQLKEGTLVMDDSKSYKNGSPMFQRIWKDEDFTKQYNEYMKFRIFKSQGEERFSLYSCPIIEEKRSIFPWYNYQDLHKKPLYDDFINFLTEEERETLNVLMDYEAKLVKMENRIWDSEGFYDNYFQEVLNCIQENYNETTQCQSMGNNSVASNISNIVFTLTKSIGGDYNLQKNAVEFFQSFNIVKEIEDLGVFAIALPNIREYYRKEDFLEGCL